MIKKIWIIFIRDLKVNTREFLTLYLLVFPILFGIGVNLLTPGITDTSISIAFIEKENVEMASYFKDFANLESFPDEEALKKRIEGRDDIIGILKDQEGSYILAQGNEPTYVIDLVKLIKTLYESDADLNETSAVIHDFGQDVPPLKTMLVNIMLLMTSVLAGMLISINIIEEKSDNTISAMHLSPVSRLGFIFGKSLIGVFLAIYGSVVLLWTTGYTDVNILQAILAIFSVSLLSIVVGFIQGLNAEDIMGAAAGVKMMFLPVAAAVASVELLSDKWQMLFYWVPYYWTYKGNVAILTKNATWPQILLYSGIVLILCAAVFALLIPRIKKGLE
ncbi:MAG: ABC transporter permease [Clostridia bacterium]|nr:ABC transporter permease [Clostridia bacterium]